MITYYKPDWDEPFKGMNFSGFSGADTQVHYDVKIDAEGAPVFGVDTRQGHVQGFEFDLLNRTLTVSWLPLDASGSFDVVAKKNILIRQVGEAQGELGWISITQLAVQEHGWNLDVDDILGEGKTVYSYDISY